MDAFTFTLFLEASRDAGFAAVGVYLQQDLVPDEHFDAVKPHLAGKIRKNLFSISKSDFEQRIRQGFFNDALYFFLRILH